MFSEILNLKLRLDTAELAKAEKSLSKRFGKVAKLFGSGLTAALRGSVLGLSLGLLNKILNPIKELEDRIEALLGESQDLTDQADRFNTSPGELRRLQDVGNSFGVKPDQLFEMLKQFQAAVELNRKQTQNNVPLSREAQAVDKFAGEKDIAEGFFQFLQSLRAEGQNNGEESRRGFERAVFGENQYGAAGRLIQGDLNGRLSQLQEPSANRLNSAIAKGTSLADLNRLRETQNETKNFLGGVNQLNPDMINAMNAGKAVTEANENARLASYQSMRQAADGIEALKEPIQGLLNVATQGAGQLGTLVGFVSKFLNSRLGRAVDKGENKK